MTRADHDIVIWTAVLDDFELVLEDQREHLDTTTSVREALPDAPRFEPPAALPPMPTALRARAIALSRRTAALIDDVETTAARIKPLDLAPRARRSSQASGAVGFDELA